MVKVIARQNAIFKVRDTHQLTTVCLLGVVNAYFVYFVERFQ